MTAVDYVRVKPYLKGTDWAGKPAAQELIDKDKHIAMLQEDLTRADNRTLKVTQEKVDVEIQLRHQNDKVKRLQAENIRLRAENKRLREQQENVEWLRKKLEALGGLTKEEPPEEIPEQPAESEEEGYKPWVHEPAKPEKKELDEQPAEQPAGEPEERAAPEIVIQLKDVMEARGIKTIQEVVDGSGVSYPTVASWYKGHTRMIGMAVLTKVCVFLKCTPGDLLVMEG